MWACLVLAVSCVGAVLIGPVVFQDVIYQYRRQRVAEQYLVSMGLPQYGGMALADRLSSHEVKLPGVRVIESHVAFHSRDDFDAVRAWYEDALPAPEWTHDEVWAIPGIGRNWKAERTLGDQEVSVRVNAPSDVAFTAVVYTVVSLKPD